MPCSDRCSVAQIHACILNPNKCRFITLPHHTRTVQQPENDHKHDSGGDAVFDSSAYDPATTLVLYPSSSALPLSDPSIAHLLPNIQRVVVIESTWQKGGAVYSHPALGLHRLQAVRLSEYESTYWRYQELGRHALCTLEAIYHLCGELVAIEEQRGGTQRRDSMCGTQLDDLLYMYAAQHSRLQTRYQQHVPDDEEHDEEKAKQAEAERGSGAASTAHSTTPLPAAVIGDVQYAQSSNSKRPTRKKPPPRAWKPM